MTSYEEQLLSTAFTTHAGLWERASQTHPFLQGCVDGSVATGAFNTWLAQDRLYVKAFLQLLQHMATRSAQREEDKALLAGGCAVVEEELRWFARMAGERGVDLSAPPLPQTQTYAAFLVAIEKEPFALQAAVLYLIEKVYLEAWTHVQAKGGENGPYAAFAKQWSGAAFRTYVDALGAMAAAAAAAGGIAPSDWETRVNAYFQQVMQLEVGFWDMATQGAGGAPRPPLPPFTHETAAMKVRAAEDAWNTRDPQRVALAYTPDSKWRNRSEFFSGRAAIVDFLTRKWSVETDYRLIKEIWAHDGHRIAVRFCYEWHDTQGQWYRSHGNENWEFDANGYMQARHASINDVPIAEADRKFRWARDATGASKRPADHPGLSELGL